MTKPAVVILTEAGRCAFQDIQTLIQALVQAHQLQLDGALAAPPLCDQPVAAREVLDAYAAAYPHLQADSSHLPAPAELHSILAKGGFGRLEAPGWSGGSPEPLTSPSPTPGDGAEPLIVLNWGPASDLTRAVQASPLAKGRIRVLELKPRDAVAPQPDDLGPRRATEALAESRRPEEPGAETATAAEARPPEPAPLHKDPLALDTAAASLESLDPAAEEGHDAEPLLAGGSSGPAHPAPGTSFDRDGPADTVRATGLPMPTTIQAGAEAPNDRPTLPPPSPGPSAGDGVIASPSAPAPPPVEPVASAPEPAPPEEEKPAAEPSAPAPEPPAQASGPTPAEPEGQDAEGAVTPAEAGDGGGSEADPGEMTPSLCATGGTGDAAAALGDEAPALAGDLASRGGVAEVVYPPTTTLGIDGAPYPVPEAGSAQGPLEAMLELLGLLDAEPADDPPLEYRPDDGGSADALGEADLPTMLLGGGTGGNPPPAEFTIGAAAGTGPSRTDPSALTEDDSAAAPPPIWHLDP